MPLCSRSFSSRGFPSRPLAFAAPLVLASSALAQGQVWVVDDQPGPGVDFTTIQAAVDATADGDVVLVKTGNYVEHVQITGRALTLIADVGADVRVQWGVGVFGNHAGQPVLVRGLHVPGNSQAYPTGLAIGNASGPVWIESCVLRGSHVQFAGPGAGVVVTNSAGVTLARCDVRGGSGTGKASPGSGGNGLFSEAPVHVFDSIIRGGDAPPITSIPFFGQTGSGGAAVTLFNGKLFASGTSLTGGTGTSGYAHPTLGCVGGGPGGAGVSGLGGAVAVVLLEAPVAGGSGGAAFGACGSGASGAPFLPPGLTPTLLSGVAHGLDIASPVREGQPISGTFHGVPNELALLALSPTPALGAVALPLSGVLLLAAPVSVFGVGSIPASGVLVVGATAALLPPGIEGGTLAAEPAFVDPSGPSAVLGAPTTLTLLDSSI